MRLPDSTEWLLHCATSLAQLEPGHTVPAARLATHYGVPPAYLAKQLQALVRAGILAATTGPHGGFRLARRPDEVTLLHIVEAVDGTSAPYRCQEIRQRGTGALPAEDCVKTCALAARMADAHRAWQQSLGAVTLADILRTLPHAIPARTRALLARPT